MKRVKIGCFPIGRDQVEIYLRSGDGGDFQTFPEKGALPRISIGADQKNWNNFCEILYHEVIEFAMVRRYLRFDPSIEGNNSAEYLFVMDHQQMNHVALAVGEFTAYGLKGIEKAYRKWGKQ